MRRADTGEAIGVGGVRPTVSLVTLAGFPVVRGSITFTLTGAWLADLVVDVENASDVQGAITLSVNGADLEGTATPQADLGNQVSVLMVGGAGGLQTLLGPQGYGESATYKDVLEDALRGGGEALSTDADAAVTSTVSRWSRVAGTVADAIRQVCAAAGCTWRVLDDGKVWVGTDSWATVTPDHTIVAEEPARSRMTVAVETLDIRPGTTFGGHRISEAVYRFDDSTLRAHVRWGSERGELAAMIGELVRREVQPAIDASAIYAYTIKSQETDGRLNVRSSDPRLPDLDKVPMQHGLMGVTENKLTGGTAYLTHENGDPSRPIVVAVAPASTRTIVLEVTEKLEIKLGAHLIKVSSSEIEITAGQSVKVGAATVQAGGTQALVKQIPFAVWAAGVVAGLAGVGGSCPAYTDPGTTVLQGS